MEPRRLSEAAVCSGYLQRRFHWCNLICASQRERPVARLSAGSGVWGPARHCMPAHRRARDSRRTRTFSSVALCVLRCVVLTFAPFLKPWAPAPARRPRPPTPATRPRVPPGRGAGVRVALARTGPENQPNTHDPCLRCPTQAGCSLVALPHATRAATFPTRAPKAVKNEQ